MKAQSIGSVLRRSSEVDEGGPRVKVSLQQKCGVPFLAPLTPSSTRRIAAPFPTPIPYTQSGRTKTSIAYELPANSLAPLTTVASYLI